MLLNPTEMIHHPKEGLLMQARRPRYSSTGMSGRMVLLALVLLGAAGCTNSSSETKNSSSQPSYSEKIEPEGLKEGRKLVKEGHLEEALKHLRAVLEKTPNDIETHRLYQDTLRALGEIDAMQKEYQARMLKSPESALEHYLYGRALILERTREAQIEFEKAIKLDPDFLWGYLGLSSAMKMNDDRFEAVQVLEKAIKRHPRAAMLYLNLADIRYSMKLYREALDAAEKCIKLDPSLPEPYETAGFSHLMQGDLTNAQKFFENAIKRSPERTSAYIGLAHVFLDKGDKAKAREYALKAKALGKEIAPDLAAALDLTSANSEGKQKK